jgi:riboflavin biosynthesis pyrimidine reductase
MPELEPPLLEPPLQALLGEVPEDLPAALLEPYGGGLGLPASSVYANFVASVDGIVAIGDVPASSKMIGGRDEGDRFVMALLRAAADVVLVGAETFREHRGPWAARATSPAAADAFAEFRRDEGRAADPVLAVVTASGRIEPKEGRARQDTLALTTRGGARALARSSGGVSDVVVVGDREILDGAGIVGALRERGFERILTEGGPRLMAQLLEARVVDELFLSVSPVLAGGGQPPGERSTLSPRLELLPDHRVPGSLRSVKRRNSYLFLRYGLGQDGPK